MRMKDEPILRSNSSLQSNMNKLYYAVVVEILLEAFNLKQIALPFKWPPTAFISSKIQDPRYTVEPLEFRNSLNELISLL